MPDLPLSPHPSWLIKHTCNGNFHFSCSLTSSAQLLPHAYHCQATIYAASLQIVFTFMLSPALGSGSLPWTLVTGEWSFCEVLKHLTQMFQNRFNTRCIIYSDRSWWKMNFALQGRSQIEWDGLVGEQEAFKHTWVHMPHFGCIFALIYFVLFDTHSVECSVYR